MLDRQDRETNTRAELEKAEIERAIVSDFDSFMARDKARWETHWVQEDRFTSIVECGPLMVSHGYPAFRDSFFQAMDMAAKPANPDVRRRNLAIHVDGDRAWAHFEQIVTDTGDLILPPSFTYKMRLFERHHDGWKVVFHGVWSLPGREKLEPAIEIDCEARVLWLNSAAEARLKTFPALTISHGKLRMARPKLQPDLEEALERAAKLLPYVRYREAERDPETGVEFPLLLGEDDDGQLLVCKVQLHGSRIYVCFGDDDRIAHCIRSAAIVFGLSDAQHRLALLISGGLGLEEAASEMGVTQNTARTHLRRMYDKTGARNQVALLRTLLAVG